MRIMPNKASRSATMAKAPHLTPQIRGRVQHRNAVVDHRVEHLPGEQRRQGHAEDADDVRTHPPDVAAEQTCDDCGNERREHDPQVMVDQFAGHGSALHGIEVGHVDGLPVAEQDHQDRQADQFLLYEVYQFFHCEPIQPQL